VQYYINYPYTDYSVYFIEYWMGDGIFCHSITGRFVVSFCDGFVTREFYCYVGVCCDDACDRIIDDILKALKQGMKKHWIEKWQKGQNRNERE
jgi:hypothetical protein